MKKIRIIVGIGLLYLIGSVFIISCNAEGSQKSKQNEEMENDGHDNMGDHSHDHSMNADQSAVNDFKHKGDKLNELSVIIDAYLELKNDLAADNSIDAAKSGSKLLSSIKGFDDNSIKESQLSEYLEIEESVIENAEHIINNANEIDHQREHLVSLSEDISDLIDMLGTDRKLYLDYCPMANNNMGAIWISELKEISNPYMGSKMLTCGKIQKEII